MHDVLVCAQRLSVDVTVGVIECSTEAGSHGVVQWYVWAGSRKMAEAKHCVSADCWVAVVGEVRTDRERPFAVGRDQRDRYWHFV